jgi:hypothetical protein
MNPLCNTLSTALLLLVLSINGFSQNQFSEVKEIAAAQGYIW